MMQELLLWYRRAKLVYFTKNLDFAWENMRGEEGLFTADWTLKERNKSKWLLDQCAFVEMYARLAKLGR